MVNSKMYGALKAVRLDALDSAVAMGLVNRTDSFSKLCRHACDKVHSVAERSVASSA